MPRLRSAAYKAIELVLEQAHDRVPLRILDYTLMPNHWHLVVWPETFFVSVHRVDVISSANEGVRHIFRRLRLYEGQCFAAKNEPDPDQ